MRWVLVVILSSRGSAPRPARMNRFGAPLPGLGPRPQTTVYETGSNVTSKMRASIAFIVAVSTCLVTGCGEDEPLGNQAGTGGAGGASIEDLPPGWTTFAPGGETRCARGTPFKYFVRRGSVNRVIIDFRGGGACWDYFT